MPTDEERREVARRLKSIRGLDCCKDPRYAVELASDAIGASHSNGYSWDKMLDRLADLIEPSCDRDMLLALADEMDAYTCCPDDDRCGKQMPPSTVHGFARRIREALGVES